MNNYGIIAIFVWSFINVWYKKLCFTGIGQHTLVGFRHNSTNAVAHVSTEVKCCTCCLISIFTSKAVVYHIFSTLGMPRMYNLRGKEQGARGRRLV